MATTTEHDLLALAAAVPLPLEVEVEQYGDEELDPDWKDWVIVSPSADIELARCDSEEVHARYLVAAASALPELVRERDKLRALLTEAYDYLTDYMTYDMKAEEIQSFSLIVDIGEALGRTPAPADGEGGV